MRKRKEQRRKKRRLNNVTTPIDQKRLRRRDSQLQGRNWNSAVAQEQHKDWTIGKNLDNVDWQHYHQQVNVLAAKPDNRSSIPEIHTEKKKCLLEVLLLATCAAWQADMHICTQHTPAHTHTCTHAHTRTHTL